MIYVFDRDEKYLGQFNIIPTLTKAIGEFNTLEFETKEVFEKDFRVLYKDGLNWHEFIIVDSDYAREHLSSTRYFCQDSIIELQNDVMLDKRPEGSFIKVLEIILKDTRFNLVNAGNYDTSKTFKNSFFRVSVLEAFQKTVEKYGIEFYTKVEVQNNKVANRNIVIGRLGKDRPSRLAFGKNIKKFSRRVLADNVVTRLYPFGKGEEIVNEETGESTGGYGRRIDISQVNDGKSYLENKEALELYGIGEKNKKRHRNSIHIFEDIEDRQELKEEGQKLLEELSKVNAEYSVEAINLNITVSLGDTVQVVDEEINFRSRVRIIKEVLHDDKREYTFGTVVKGFTNSITEKIKEEIEPLAIQISSKLSETLKKIEGDFLKEDGYNKTLEAGNEYGLPGGLYSFEKPLEEGPLKAIYVGAGKLLIWTRDNVDSNWELLTAIDEGGINGQAIITNSITANKLASDVGQGLELSSNEYIQNIVQTNSNIETQLQEYRSNLSNELNNKADKSTVEEMNTELINSIQENSSKIIQTEDSFTQTYERLQANLTNNQVELEKLTAVIQSGMDSEGNAYTDWIGNENNKVRVGSDGIVMYSDNTETMKLKDGAGYMDSLYVTNRLGLGNHTAQKIGTTYTVFVPVGGNDG